MHYNGDNNFKLENNLTPYMLIKKAYDESYLPAIKNLSVCYEEDNIFGVSKNLNKAIQLSNEALKKEDYTSDEQGVQYFMLGMLYTENEDENMALKSFHKAVKLYPFTSVDIFKFYNQIENQEEKLIEYWEKIAIEKGYKKEIDEYYLNISERFKLMREQEESEFQYQQARRRSSCYVVTATMGDENHPRVTLIREFRDNTLANYHLGQQFIRWYYEKGPILARFVDNSWVLKKLSYYFVVLPMSEMVRFFRK